MHDSALRWFIVCYVDVPASLPDLAL